MATNDGHSLKEARIVRVSMDSFCDSDLKNNLQPCNFSETTSMGDTEFHLLGWLTVICVICSILPLLLCYCYIKLQTFNIQQWAKENELDNTTLQCLRKDGFFSKRALVLMTTDCIDHLNINPAQKLLLKSALGILPLRTKSANTAFGRPGSKLSDFEISHTDTEWFNEFALRVGAEITAEDFKQLKFLCDGILDKACIEKLHYPRELIMVMKDRKIIQHDNVDYLCMLLDKIKQKKLASDTRTEHSQYVKGKRRKSMSCIEGRLNRSGVDIIAVLEAEVLGMLKRTEEAHREIYNQFQEDIKCAAAQFMNELRKNIKVELVSLKASTVKLTIRCWSLTSYNSLKESLENGKFGQLLTCVLVTDEMKVLAKKYSVDVEITANVKRSHLVRADKYLQEHKDDSHAFHAAKLSKLSGNIRSSRKTSSMEYLNLMPIRAVVSRLFKMAKLKRKKDQLKEPKAPTSNKSESRYPAAKEQDTAALVDDVEKHETSTNVGSEDGNVRSVAKVEAIPSRISYKMQRRQSTSCIEGSLNRSGVDLEAALEAKVNGPSKRTDEAHREINDQLQKDVRCTAVEIVNELRKNMKVEPVSIKASVVKLTIRCWGLTSFGSFKEALENGKFGQSLTGVLVTDKMKVTAKKYSVDVEIKVNVKRSHLVRAEKYLQGMTLPVSFCHH